MLISPAFLQHAQDNFLPADQKEAFIQACQRPLRKSIRLNALKTNLSQFKAIMANYGIELEAIPWCDQGFWLKNASIANNLADTDSKTSYLTDLNKIGLWPEHLQGLFYIQEASSMLPPMALLAAMDEGDKESLKILDMAAAPGSKTTQLAAMLDNQGLILANELSASRLKGLQANLVRTGVANACLSQFDGRKLGARLEGVFDYVLLDAPCGGEGTVRKDPKALQDWTPEQLEPLAELQKQLLASAYQSLKPGGRLVYSTCSLSPQENQQVVNQLIASTDAQVSSLEMLFEGAEQALTSEGYLLLLPHIYDSEGFFVAAVKKPVASKVNPYPAEHKNHFQSLNKKNAAQFLKFLQHHFDFDGSGFSSRLFQRDKEIWLMPKGYDDINPVMRLNRSGIKLADCYPNKFRLTHEFASCFYSYFNKQEYPLDLAQLKAFYQGKDLSITQQTIEEHCLLNGELILKYQNAFVGLGNLQKTKIKNRLPRDRVVDKLDW